MESRLGGAHRRRRLRESTAPSLTRNGSSRWLPFLFTTAAAFQFGDVLAQIFIWHAATVLIEAQGAIAAAFALLAILFQWDLRR
ncbi:MAG: hypothetical protein L3K05_07640, partial [Thermoplasmata archaeon]|nr:hypothetical protein [Thermoplasmata archaeon]